MAKSYTTTLFPEKEPCYYDNGTKCRLTQHSLYSVWSGIRSRCMNQKNKNYGGRGISICDEWKNNPIAFIYYVEKNLGLKPTLEHSIDRINNDGNYEPNNIRWATPFEQANNTRKQRWFFAFNVNTGKWDEDNSRTEFRRRWKLYHNSYAKISLCLLGKKDSCEGWIFKYL